MKFAGNDHPTDFNRTFAFECPFFSVHVHELFGRLKCKERPILLINWENTTIIIRHLLPLPHRCCFRLVVLKQFFKPTIHLTSQHKWANTRICMLHTSSALCSTAIVPTLNFYEVEFRINPFVHLKDDCYFLFVGSQRCF